MQEWAKISLKLCFYGFFSGMTPFSHFMFKFLTEFRGISAENVSDFFLAQFSYWNIGLLAIVFLITDMLRYKPLIILSALSGVAYYTVMRWTVGLYPLIAAAFLYGLQLATDVAYFTYIYAKVDKEHYQQVTSNSRSAVLFGRCTGAFLSQFLMMYELVTVDKLLYISLANQIVAFCISVSLPAAQTSIYFYQASSHRKQAVDGPNEDGAKAVEVEEETLVKFSWTNAKGLLWSHFKSGYSNKTVLLWSFWWALMQTGFRMVYAYNQPLWHFIEPDRETEYNGFAEAGLTLFGALGALLAGRLNQQFVEKAAIWIMVACSLCQGTFSVLAGRTTTVFLSYAMYMLFGAAYYFMVTVCSAIVAKNLVKDSFGLIFGINTWMSLLFTVIFTVFVVSGSVVTLNPRQQYTIYGCYFFGLAVVYTLYGAFRSWQGGKRRRI